MRRASTTSLTSTTCSTRNVHDELGKGHMDVDDGLNISGQSGRSVFLVRRPCGRQQCCERWLRLPSPANPSGFHGDHPNRLRIPVRVFQGGP